MAVSKTQFTQWVRKCMSDGCRMLRLVHFPDRGPALARRVRENEDAEAIAETVLECALMHAHALGGIQRYVVEAFFGEDTAHEREFVLMFRNAGVTADEGADKTVGQIVDEAIRAEVENAVKPLRARIAELEAKLAEAGLTEAP